MALSTRRALDIQTLPQEVLFLVLDKLDLKDRFRLGACAKGILAAVISHKGWSYHPFTMMSDRVWRRFYERVWRSSVVTRALRRAMRGSVPCEFAPNEAPEIPEQPDYWMPSDDLWRYSPRPELWNDIINERLTMFVASEGSYHDWQHEFRDDLWQEVRWRGLTRDEFEDYLYEEFLQSDMYSDLWHEHEPDEASREAQAMRGGADRLAPAMVAAAKMVFGKQGARMVKSTRRGERAAVVKKYKWVFDLTREAEDGTLPAELADRLGLDTV